jgi:hypothetical protein
MKMIASRNLAARPGRVWDELQKEGAVVITKDGVPCSIMVPTSDTTLLEDIQEVVFSRARRAVRSIRAQALESGFADMTMDEIDSEIQAARRERKRRMMRG